MCIQYLSKIIILLFDNSTNDSFDINNNEEISNSLDYLKNDTNNINDRFYNYGISDLIYN